MTQPIDIVIPWLNPTEAWFNDYKRFCEDENPCRIRDMNTIRPALASIIKNLPWIRYIWLIVYNEEQIPSNWEELKNDKIKFILHKDIVPAELLPTFNSMIVECFAHKINDLAENFIFANDDMIFAKYVPAEFFFKNDKVVHRKNNTKVRTPHDNNMYQKILNTTCKFIAKLTGKEFWSEDYHMPIPIKKQQVEELWKLHAEDIISSTLSSKIRKPHNFAFMNILFTLDEVNNTCLYDEMKNIKTKMIRLTDNTTLKDIKELKNYHIVCLNDSETLVKKYKDVAKYIKEVFS